MGNTFKELSQIDVSNHLETKQGLSYLQWMACWSLLKDYDPEAEHTIHTDANGNPFFTTSAGTFVRTSIQVKGKILSEVLPVLDMRNKAVMEDKLNTFDINSAYKRCLVKNAALHGLGAQVYIDGQGTPLDLSKGLSKKKAAPKKPAAPKTGGRTSF